MRQEAVRIRERDFADWKLLAWGADSNVFVDPRCTTVLKVYQRYGEHAEVVAHYVRLMNTAASWGTNKVDSIVLPFPAGSERWRCLFSVCPVAEVCSIQDTSGSIPATKSAYIAGPRRSDMSDEVEMYNSVTTLRQLGASEREIRMLQSLHHDLKLVPGLLRPVSDVLSKMELSLSSYFAESGIEILPVNCKLRIPEPHVLHLIATDICTSFQRLNNPDIASAIA